MATRKQIRANRKNGLKGGAKSWKSREVARLNARKHGIFASALTTEDAKDLYFIEDQLIAEIRPVGRTEEMLTEKLALTYLRMQRCARAEAEYHVRAWKEPNIVLDSYEWDRLKKRRDCGDQVSPFRSEPFKVMVELIGLYDVRLTNQFLRLLHEIERRQRLRKGENVPAPVVGDLSIHTDAERPTQTARFLAEQALAAQSEVQPPLGCLTDGRQNAKEAVVPEDRAKGDVNVEANMS